MKYKTAFCRKGHNRDLLGRTSTGSCKTCKDQWQLEHKDEVIQKRKQWKFDNKEQQTAYLIEYTRKNNDIIVEAKNKPCMDCGIKYPFYVMQFDHRPDENKLFVIGAHRNNRSADKILAEIAKCDIVCANCHSIRTWNRKHAFKEQKEQITKDVSL